jgi:hypothetical protein
MADNVFDEIDALADEIDALTEGPSDDEIANVTQMCAQLLLMEQAKTKMESMLSDLNKDIYKMAHQKIPDALDEIGQDLVGLPDAGVNIQVQDYCKASIPKSWDDEKRTMAFSHLNDLGLGDIVKTKVEVVLGKDSMDDAVGVVETINSFLEQHGLSESVSVDMGMDVPWNSLTSAVKKYLQGPQDVPINLEMIGAQTGRVAKIKKR